MTATTRQTGLMLATMEPAASFEEEFQKWYDTEHFPERHDTPGFLTATRMVCLSGWPRYIALYDLESLDVLDGPDYAKIAGKNYTRWTARIISMVWGQYRAGAKQVYPGNALLGQAGSFSRLALWRFCNVPAGMAQQVTEGLRAIYDGQPETAQLRVFEAQQNDGTDIIALVELHAPFEPPAGSVAKLKDARRYIDCVNVYTPYERRRETSFPKPA